MRRLRSVLLLTAVAFCAGCAFFYKQPEIGFRGLSLGNIGRRGAALEIAADIFNPNRFRLGLKSLTYRLNVNGVESGSGATTAELEVPPRETATLRLPVQLDWSGLQSRALEMLTSGGLDYTVEGEATFSTPMGTFRRPYRRTGRIGR